MSHHAEKLLATSGWANTFTTLRGPPDLSPEVSRIRHPAARLLEHFRLHGVPVVTQTLPWTEEQLEAARKRGPHQSVQEYAEFLMAEMLAMVKKGQWIVLPYRAAKLLKGLRLSPPGVVPQRDRRARTIVDYTFSFINAEILRMMPAEAMQFGKALLRILQNIVEANPKWGPVYLAKFDVSDGFYRIRLAIRDALKLAVVFLPDSDGETMVAIPCALPMGWTESPPGFSAATETVCDLANQDLREGVTHGPHKLENLTRTLPPPEDPWTWPRTNQAKWTWVEVPPEDLLPVGEGDPVEDWDVYVDDFMGQAQGDEADRSRVTRSLLHSMDKVFRPLEPSDPSDRKEPISIKKLQKGEAHWSTRKTILGWDIDTVAGTISLPTHRREKLHTLLESIPRTKRRISNRRWQKALGELRSLTLAIPGLKGLFSLLQAQLTGSTNNRTALTAGVHDTLADIRMLVNSMDDRPTRIREVVPTPAAAIGCADAAKPGMGGVFFIPERMANGETKERAFLWRQQFPPDLQEQLVSWDNPTGTITNSDLELAAAIAQQDVMAHTADLRDRTIHTHSDNTPTVAWLRKGSNSKAGPTANLLRLHAFHQRTFRYHPKHDYIAGPANAMADDCSRRWDLGDDALLTHFNSTFPQANSWTVCQLPPETNSRLTCALRGGRQGGEWFSAGPKPQIRPGMFGPTSAPKYNWTHSSPRSTIRSPSSRYTRGGSAMAEPPRVEGLSSMGRWTRNYERWARRSPYWGPTTPGSTTTGPLTSACGGKYDATPRKIRPLTGSNQYHSRSFTTWRIEERTHSRPNPQRPRST